MGMASGPPRFVVWGPGVRSGVWGAGVPGYEVGGPYLGGGVYLGAAQCRALAVQQPASRGHSRSYRCVGYGPWLAVYAACLLQGL